MPDQPNFLLGNGHVLASPVDVRRRMDTPPPPYTVEEAKQRVIPMLRAASAEAAALPAAACPGDYAVGVITLHPQYTAKSYFPATLFQESGLLPIGSRAGSVKPDRLRDGRRPSEREAPRETVDLFVAGRRRALDRLPGVIQGWQEGVDRGAEDLFKVERFRAARAADRLRNVGGGRGSVLLDVAIHSPDQVDVDVLAEFIQFARGLGAQPDPDRRFEVGGLVFLPVAADSAVIPQIGQFAFLRVVRAMPPLRPLRPITRTARPLTDRPPAFPANSPVDPDLRVAVFDGGLPPGTTIRQFATAHDADGVGPPLPAYQDHGMGVTSALLFGVIPQSGELPRPYAHVDHYRVLDNRCATHLPDPNLYDVLHRIRRVLQTGRYQYANISLGPAYPIEDDEVNPWTATLDELLSDGNLLLTVAVGNDGEKDWESGNARVQVPSDCVNALAIGACDSESDEWGRAAYSCVGPGRSPGRMKPDAVAFGGVAGERPFTVLDRSGRAVVPQHGTSFASPLALRRAVGIRAHYGTALSPLAIRALLLHCCERSDGLDRREVGWGRLPGNLDDYVVCRPGEVRVMYQGRLSPGQFLRTPIPLPADLPACDVWVTATFCIASVTDPQDPANYTRSGLDITFRPNATKLEGVHAKSDSFFRLSDYDTERTLRDNAHKWETVAHASKRKRSASLNEPVFDVHYQTRVGGRKSRATEAIHYALVVTVRAPRVPDIYDRVVRRYQTVLAPIRPVQAIQIRT